MVRFLHFSQTDRYIFGKLVLTASAVAAGLTALIWLTQVPRYIDFIFGHGLSVFTFVGFTFLLTPTFLIIILPISCFIATQFVYLRLASDSELTALRAVGASDFNLARPALLFALFFAFLCAGITLWLAPLSMYSFRQEELRTGNKLASLMIEPGVFTHIGGGVTLYVRSRSPDGVLEGIFLHDTSGVSLSNKAAGQATSKAQNNVVITAESGQIIPEPDSINFLLINGSQQQINKKTGHLSLLAFKSNLIRVEKVNSGGVFRYSARDAPFLTLFNPGHYHISGAEAYKWRAEIFQRISVPFTVFSYVLTALLMVLTGDFSRKINPFRPVIGFLLMAGLVILGITAFNTASANNRFIFFIIVQALLPALICIRLLFFPVPAFLARYGLRKA